MLTSTVGLQCWVKYSVNSETTNPKDKNAVAVHIEEIIVDMYLILSHHICFDF